jgi:hypothetical protein
MKTSGCASLHEEEEGEVVVVFVLSRFGSTTSESKKDFRSELFLSTESFRNRRLRQGTRIRCAAFEEEEAIKKKALSLSQKNSEKLSSALIATYMMLMIHESNNTAGCSISSAAI